MSYFLIIGLNINFSTNLITFVNTNFSNQDYSNIMDMLKYIYKCEEYFSKNLKGEKIINGLK